MAGARVLSPYPFRDGWLESMLDPVGGEDGTFGRCHMNMHNFIRAIPDRFTGYFQITEWLHQHAPSHVELDARAANINLGDVPKWQDWGKLCRRLTGWRQESHDYQWFSLDRPDFDRIVRRTTNRQVQIDIADICGFASSKSNLSAFANTDEMALAWREFDADDLSEQNLARMLDHREIRLLHQGSTDDCFCQFQWDARLWLSNAGGSHHFAGAKYIAAQLGKLVPITGDLVSYSFDNQVLASMTNEFDLFAIPSQSVDAYHAAMESFSATWLQSSMPEPYDGITVVFLPRSEPKSMRVAADMRRAGVADLSHHLLYELPYPHRPSNVHQAHHVLDEGADDDDTQVIGQTM